MTFSLKMITGLVAPKPASAAPKPTTTLGALALQLMPKPTLAALAQQFMPTAAAREKPIVLIACSDTKIDTRSAVPAAELYAASSLFRKSLAYARSVTSDENIRILSALHGVLRTTDRIKTYDFPITKLSARERDDWGERAHTTLLTQFGQRYPREVLVLAGEEYVRALRGLTGSYRLDALPWTMKYPFGAARGERMQIGERLQWLNKELLARGKHAPTAPKKPVLKPGRIRMNTKGRPWRNVEALAWEGDFFVHRDLEDDDLFVITHAPSGRKLAQRYTDERSAIVLAADLNDPAVSPSLQRFVEAVEKNRPDQSGTQFYQLLEAREPLRAEQYRQRYGQLPPSHVVAPPSERTPQSQLRPVAQPKPTSWKSPV